MMKEVAIPRYLVGYKLTAIAITRVAQLQQHKNTMKLITMALNSVRKFIAMHVNADTTSQQAN